ncbi:UbiA prenyltransferase family-domain-containing protein [Dunaliella salina]|uniref:UbiA prenyltransferase family-domain-containing protein n=1 Tax=Dunaliella salina TaxID=3046 RepID=A0ABQ7GKS9_DUNSA|nr:UbiA prenyltransferase family-domain-containing protein [Dunaliella salina]|eukprot:KAF5835217.1 UbiA prenyltransferase family-domain-containing protein [Dunaliella salina]
MLLNKSGVACNSQCVAQRTSLQARSPLHLASSSRSVLGVTSRKQLSPHAGRQPVSTRAQPTEKEADTKGDADSAARQMMGMKGAALETDVNKIRIQLMKPVTWIPLIWGVACGAAASGHYQWNNPMQIAQLLTCMMMSGPALTGFTQTINDYFDKDIDAINEPYRPIPSGRISEGEVIAQIFVLLGAGLGIAFLLDKWVGHEFPQLTALAAFGTFVSYIYSAPPLKLKQSGWAGNYALGSSYIALPWWAGQSLFGTLTPDVAILTILYSIAGLGIAIVNDFKSIEGDRQMGLNSLPVAFGVDTAKYICVGSIDITQLGVAAYLAFGLHENVYAAVLLGLVLPQIFFQIKYFLPDPIENDVTYQARAQPFLVFGLLTTGLAVGASNSI